MIELQVENYCQNCSDFKPKIDRIHEEYFGCLQTVYCANRERCENIYQEAMKEARMEVRNEH